MLIPCLDECFPINSRSYLRRPKSTHIDQDNCYQHHLVRQVEIAETKSKNGESGMCGAIDFPKSEDIRIYTSFDMKMKGINTHHTISIFIFETIISMIPQG